MVQINWGLQQGGNSFQNALGQGLQLGQIAKEREAENALAAYAIDPQADGAFESLAKTNPRMALRERANQQEQQKQQQFVELRRAALGGDKTAQMELATVDTDAYNRMTDDQRKQVDEQDDMLADGIFNVLSAPEEQRSAVWDSIAKDIAPQYVGQYSPETLNTIASRAGISERLQKFQDPKYQVIPEGGTLVDTNNMGAVSQFAAPQPSAQGGNVSKEEGKQIVTGWGDAGYATRDQIEVIKRSMGGNQQAVDAYIRKQGLAVVDEVKRGPDGSEYYLINGKVYDNPRGQ